jgi:hypothetical protein
METEHGIRGCFRRSTRDVLVIVGRTTEQRRMDGAEGCSHPDALGSVDYFCARK